MDRFTPDPEKERNAEYLKDRILELDEEFKALDTTDLAIMTVFAYEMRRLYKLYIPLNDGKGLVFPAPPPPKDGTPAPVVWKSRFTRDPEKEGNAEYLRDRILELERQDKGSDLATMTEFAFEMRRLHKLYIPLNDGKGLVLPVPEEEEPTPVITEVVSLPTGTVSLNGKGLAGSSLEIVNVTTGVVIGRTTVQENRDWSFTPYVDPGKYSFVARYQTTTGVVFESPPTEMLGIQKMPRWARRMQR